MTIALDVLKKVYHTYEGDTDYPEFADDDMQLYFAHLVDSVEEWMNRFPKYREMFAYLSDAVDGDKQTTAGAETIDAPSNFVRPANFIKVDGKKLEYIPPEKMELHDGTLEEWFSIIGMPGAYKIVIHPTPGSVVNVSYPYYKTLTKPTTENSTIEVSRPFFCLYYILNKLYLDDAQNKDLAKMYEDKMDEQERLERVSLAMTPTGTPNQARDMNFLKFGSGFGRLSSNAEK